MLHQKLSMTPLEAVAKMAKNALQSARESKTAQNGSYAWENADGTKTLVGVISGTDDTDTQRGFVQWVGDTEAPGTPTGVTARCSGGGTLIVSWDGTLNGGVPSDFDHISIVVDGTSRGRLVKAGSLAISGLSVGVHFVSAVAYDAARLDDGSLAPNASTASTAFSVEITNESAEAKTLAQQAEAVATATGQHFWPDTDGVHVTEVTQDEWNDSTSPNYHSGANVLLNALGQLFRDGVNNLLALVAGTAHSETFTVESYVYDPTYSYMATHTIGVEHIAIQSVTFDGSEFPKFSATTRRGWVYKKSTNLLSLRFHQSDSALGKQVTVNYRTFASIAIYDGTGNDAENIAASFSADDIMLGGSIDGDVDDDKASIRFFGGSVDTETTYIDASGGIGTSSITGDPCYLNREIALGNIVTDSRLYDDSGRRANGFVSFAQSISDSYNTGGETTSSYVNSYVSMYSGTNNVANYAAIMAMSVDNLLDSSTSDTETYTEVSARADRLRLEDTSGDAIITMRQAIIALQQPYAMFTGSSGTTTATAGGWRITWFNTVYSHSANWSDYFSFSNGVITAKENIQLEISGCMNWTDSIAGNRGFGVFVNSSTVGSGSEYSAFQYFPNTVNTRKSVWLTGLVLSLNAGVQCAVGRFEQTNAVYVNGANFSRIELKVLGTF